MMITLLAWVMLQGAPPPAAIDGVVVDAANGQPIANATVEVSGIAGPATFSAMTTSSSRITISVTEQSIDGRVLSFVAASGRDGRFSIRNIPGGAYHIVAIHSPDHVPAHYGQRSPTSPGHPLNLVAGQHVENLRIEMAPSATVSGRVLDNNGKPLRDVVVDLIRPWYVNGARIVGDSVFLGKLNVAATRQTNSRGEFTFYGLYSGQYYVRSRGVPNEPLLRTYFPSAISDNVADPINLQPGTHASAMDITLLRRKITRVRGRITGVQRGSRAESTQVTILRRGESALSSSSVTTQFRGDTFDVFAPHSGSYWIYALVNTRDGVLYGRTAVEIRDDDVNNVLVEVAPTFDLSGRVIVQGLRDADTPLDKTAVRISLQPVSRSGRDPLPADVQLTAGSFVLRSITPGDYRVELGSIMAILPAVSGSALENAYIESIRMGDSDPLNEGLHLEAAPKDPLEIVISMNGGIVEGHVLGRNGEPRPNTQIVLVPEKQRSRRDLYKSTFTDDAGEYLLTGISPGTYELYAWEEHVEDGSWEDPRFLSLHAGRGTRVEVLQRGRQSMDAVLLPALGAISNQRAR